MELGLNNEENDLLRKLETPGEVISLEKSDSQD